MKQDQVTRGPVATASRGAAAGATATLLMTAAMLLAQRAGWMTELAPTRITRRSLAATPAGAPSGPTLAMATAGAHLAIGAIAGAAYALLERMPLSRRLPGAVRGVVFGTALWATAYVGLLPALGLMPRPDRDQRRRPLAMLAAHWIHGLTLAVLLRPDPLGHRLSRRAAPGARRSRAG